jgi:type I restriction enzyme S subunit
MKSKWQTKCLGDVCEIIKGRKPLLRESPSNGDLPYLVAKVMRGSEKPQFASIKDKNSVVVAESETIIICDGSNSGEVFTGFRGVLSSTMGKISKKTEIDDDYLRTVLASTFVVFNAAKTGTAIPHLDKEAMYAFQFPCPPLPEQKRIVGILDEAFDGIATAKACAEKNLQNARELFKSYLQSAFSHRGEGWTETTLGDVCQFENGDRGKNYPKREEYVESGIPWINTGHIQPDGTLSAGEMNFISRGKYESLRSGKIRPGDLVYCLRGATLGKTALVDPFTAGAVASSLVIIRPSDLLDRRFLYYFLTSPVGQRLIRLYDNGAAQPNLGAQSVAKYTISLPKLAEQKVIVQKLDALATETQLLASIYEQKLAALDTLKKSLLHEAFTGAL